MTSFNFNVFCSKNTLKSPLLVLRVFDLVMFTYAVFSVHFLSLLYLPPIIFSFHCLHHFEVSWKYVGFNRGVL